MPWCHCYLYPSLWLWPWPGSFGVSSWAHGHNRVWNILMPAHHSIMLSITFYTYELEVQSILNWFTAPAMSKWKWLVTRCSSSKKLFVPSNMLEQCLATTIWIWPTPAYKQHPNTFYMYGLDVIWAPYVVVGGTLIAYYRKKLHFKLLSTFLL